VKQGDTILGVGMVNVDPREADLRPVALARLQPGPGGEVRVFQGEDELAQAGQTRPLWPLLAMAAAACLAGEMLLLAWWRRPARMGALAVEPTREPAPAKEAAG
jgi:hypothetical protein